MKRDIKKDKELCEKATPGPWTYDGHHNEIHTLDEYWLILSECRSAPDQNYSSDNFGHKYDANFAFIAEARTALPYYIQRAERLEKAWRDYAEKVFTSYCICPMDRCRQGDMEYPDKDVCHKCWLDFIEGLCEVPEDE